MVLSEMAINQDASEVAKPAQEIATPSDLQVKRLVQGDVGHDARIIVVGNEKGGSGKTTTAMHLIVALLHAGLRVASIDVDSRQASLTRFFANRRAYARKQDVKLPMSEHSTIGADARGRAQALIRLLRAINTHEYAEPIIARFLTGHCPI